MDNLRRVLVPDRGGTTDVFIDVNQKLLDVESARDTARRRAGARAPARTDESRRRAIVRASPARCVARDDHRRIDRASRSIRDARRLVVALFGGETAC
jgi:hypothetical protein